MADIVIIVDDPGNGRKVSITVPDDWGAGQLASALAQHFNLPLQAGGIHNQYKLVRDHDMYILQDTDTLHRLRAKERQMYILLLEDEVKEYIEETRRDQIFHIPSFAELLLGFLLGGIFIVFSFPTGITNLGNRWSWSLLQNTGTTVNSLFNSIFGLSGSAQVNADFNGLLTALGVSLLVYLCVLAALSLRHGRFDLFGFGVLFLLISTVCIQIIAWIIYLLGWILAFLFMAVKWIFQLIVLIFAGIWWLLVTITSFLASSGWWILAALLIAGVVIYLIIKLRDYLLAIFIGLLPTALIVGVAFLLIKFLLPFLGRFFGPVLTFLGRIFGGILWFLGYVFMVLLGGFVVYGLGALLIDQFRGAWSSGNGRRGVILGALSIGTSLALLLLETNFHNILAFPFSPPEFLRFVVPFHQNTPIFDTIITLLVVSVSIIGVLRNLAKLLRGPGWRAFKMATVIGVPLGIVAGIVVLIVQSHTGDNS